MKAQTGIWTFEGVGPRSPARKTVRNVTDSCIGDKPTATGFAVSPIMETAMSDKSNTMTVPEAAEILQRSQTAIRYNAAVLGGVKILGRWQMDADLVHAAAEGTRPTRARQCQPQSSA